MQYNKLQNILENICQNEGIDKLNMVVNKLVQLDDTKLTHIVPVIEYAEDSSSDAIVRQCAPIANNWKENIERHRDRKRR